MVGWERSRTHRSRAGYTNQERAQVTGHGSPSGEECLLGVGTHRLPARVLLHSLSSLWVSDLILPNGKRKFEKLAIHTWLIPYWFLEYQTAFLKLWKCIWNKMTFFGKVCAPPYLHCALLFLIGVAASFVTKLLLWKGNGCGQCVCMHSPEMMCCTIKLERFALLVCGSSKLNSLQSKIKLYSE